VAELFLKFFYTSSVKKINKEFVMLDTRYNPNIRMRDFRRGFDLLNSMLDEFNIDNNTELKNDFSPAINTREGEYAYHIEVDLPGMKKDDINIQVEDNTLVISGER
jgi:HSP20 family protein